MADNWLAKIAKDGKANTSDQLGDLQNVDAKVGH